MRCRLPSVLTLVLLGWGTACTERSLEIGEPRALAAQRCELADPPAQRRAVAVGTAARQLWVLWSDGTEEAVAQLSTSYPRLLRARGDLVVVASYYDHELTMFDLRARQARWVHTIDNDNVEACDLGSDGRTYLRALDHKGKPYGLTISPDGVAEILPGSFQWLLDDDTAVLSRPRHGFEAGEQYGWWRVGQAAITEAPLEAGGKAARGDNGAIVYPIHDPEHHRIAIARPTGTVDLAAPVAGTFTVAPPGARRQDWDLGEADALRFLRVDAPSERGSLLALDTRTGAFLSRRGAPAGYTALGDEPLGIDQASGDALSDFGSTGAEGLYRWDPGAPMLIGATVSGADRLRLIAQRGDAVAFEAVAESPFEIDSVGSLQIASLGTSAHYVFPEGDSTPVVLDATGTCALYAEGGASAVSLRVLRLGDGYTRPFGPPNAFERRRRYLFVD